MAILETALLFTAILVSVGSVFFLRSAIQEKRNAVQRNRDAEQKYRQSREARLSAEDALRRAENEHRESERKLQQAQNALQTAEKIRQQAQAEVRVANDARDVAIKERNEANERAQLAEELQTRAEHERDAANKRAGLAEQARTRAEEERDVAKRERDDAIEQARLANERAGLAEQARTRAEEERDAARREHNEAIQARKIAEENTRRAIQAKFDAEEQAHLAIQRAEELRKQAEDARDAAIKERDAALEQARLASERAQHAAELQAQAERERDAANERAGQAKKERDEAIAARKVAEEDSRRAIQDKFAAEERAKQAEKEHDDAKEQARLAKEAQSKTEKERDDANERANKAEKKRDAERERAEKAEKEVAELKKTSKPAPDVPSEPPQTPKPPSVGEKPPKLTISLDNRPPQRSDEPISSKPSTPRQPQPEITCIQKQNEWVLRVELPQELLERYPDPQVFQNGIQLDGTEDSWQLNDARGNLVVRADGKDIWQTDLGEWTDDPLLFKLIGKSEHGRRVRAVTQGWFLLVVPEHWKHASYEPQFVSVRGYHAYWRLIDDRREISFQTSSGKNKAVTPRVAQFTLIGKDLHDADELQCPLFGDELPNIRAANPNAWQQVKTIVLGEEGRARKNWESIPITPVANKAEQDLPTKILSWQGSWFFVRFYDENDQLIESMDFRLARGLSDIQVNQASPFPGEDGHSATSVEFHHTAECTIQPPSDFTAVPSERGTRTEIPASATSDKTCWRIIAEGHEDNPIDITVLVERIWWAVGTKDKTPSDSEWNDKPLSLTRTDFAAVSEKVLWIRLPKPRWTDTVLVGFSQETARPFPVKVTEQTVSIPLCEFESNESLRQISVSRFGIWVGDSNATLAYVRVQAKCRHCDFSADLQTDMMTHIESRHLIEIFQSLTYEEHRKRNPALPRRIAICLICWEQGYHFVAREDSPKDNVNDMMKDHKRQKRHAHNFYEELTDVEKIRERLPSLIPDIQRCTLHSCEWEKEEPSKADLLRHLKENHLNALYELR